MAIAIRGRLSLALAALSFVATPVAVASNNDELQLPTPSAPEAVAHWQAGRITDALASLDRLPAASRLKAPLDRLLLRAALLSATDQPAAAETLWREVIAREVWMRTFCRRALVESLARRGRPAEAEAVLAELTRSDATRHLDLTLRVADSYRRAGSSKPALRLYHQVLRHEDRGVSADASRLGLSAVMEQASGLDETLAMLRETKIQHWRADTFQQARGQERRLALVNRRTLRPFSEAEYRMLVRRLRNASRHQTALALLDEWSKSYPSTSRPDLIDAERVTTLYAQRANTEAVATAERFYDRFPNSALHPNVRLTDFRLAVRMGDVDRARRTGLALWQGRVRGSGNQERRNAARLLAPFLVSVGDVTGGLELYRDFFRTATSADEQRAILWQAGVAALRDDQNERALANLRDLMSRHPTGELVPAGLYWLGVAEAETGITADAIRSFQSILNRFPNHYYGMQARKRLGGLTAGQETGDNLLTLDFPTLKVSRTSQDQPEYKAAMLLARAGLTKDAASYLRRLLGRRQQDQGLALLAARASADAGNYARVSQIIANHFSGFLSRPANNLPEDFWHMVYPRPFLDEIDSAARNHDVDPMLLLALMRQESRFDPAARSPVGAIGLLQIMPYAASALAESAGVAEIVDGDRVDETALIDPAINTAIAARMIHNLLEMFDGALSPVVASYNAGEERVAIWWESARHLSEDFFVDTIPYSETRRFVRQVLANYAAYQQIYGSQVVSSNRAEARP